MTQQAISIGAAPNDGTGDTLRTAFAKINANIAELYAALAALGPAVAGALQKGNNLGDLLSVAAARDALDLGGAATLNVGTATGTVAAGDDPRILGALQAAEGLPEGFVDAPTALSGIVPLANLPTDQILTWIATPPASAASPGVAPSLASDGTYIYLCVAPNTWLRVSTTSSF